MTSLDPHTMMTEGYLVLALPNGLRVFQGQLFGAAMSTAQQVVGEVVFQTGMVGYPESLTDPSYSQQILILTYPLIGNYGVPDLKARDTYGLLQHTESEHIHVKALVVGEYINHPCHYQSQLTLDAWLKQEGVAGLQGVDTRLLTTLIREHGTVRGTIHAGSAPKTPPPVTAPTKVETHLAERVVSQANAGSHPKVRVLRPKGTKNIMVIDCGIKTNQLRLLLSEPDTCLVVVPLTQPFAERFDAARCTHLFISNGPGDPHDCGIFIARLRAFLERRPDAVTFGICLGHQLLALAAGHSVVKMKYGNRGHNIPCQLVGTTRTFITTQNHGYAVELNDTSTSGGDQGTWQPLFVNLNNKSNEGLVCTDPNRAPCFSVQFHPEAKGGPNDTASLMRVFLEATKAQTSVDLLQTLYKTFDANPKPEKARTIPFRKVLILGSGGLTIGQSGEFDYSGAQAIKAYREEGLTTVLVNPNVATVQTTPGYVDKVYFLPVTPHFVERVINIERPDCIALAFGGQTALNCGAELYTSGILEKYNLAVLGTPVESILLTEDRDKFKQHIQALGEQIPNGAIANNTADAIVAAERIGYPVLVRAAFALGGLGSGFAHNTNQLEALLTQTFAHSSQVIIDKSLRGWKEVEYEIVRDAAGNCISVCNMENFDPLGVHTGESIVIAPSQTLTDDEYMLLRGVGIKTVNSLGIVGECNIQYALDPNSKQYYIIEINARLSRSSALASKATGYPLAYIAAKLSLGYRLDELTNTLTGNTSACFEPSLDYCVVKMPRWDLTKFERVDTHIGSAMKSVGEGMSISRSFEEALQSVIRMTDLCQYGLIPGVVPYSDALMREPTYKRIMGLASGLIQDKITLEHIHALSGIDSWFLYKMQHMVRTYHAVTKGQSIPLRKLKQLGYSDAAIARAQKTTELVIRQRRLDADVIPDVKKIDTVAAEFPCTTNYLYPTYATKAQPNATNLTTQSDTVLVLGSGVYKIGSSVEFDWCAVSCIRQLRKLGKRVIMVNCNPETVSTDYDEADALYFVELSLECVLDIVARERPMGVVLSVGGQLPNNIAMALHLHNVPVLGTSPKDIDRAENRFKFSRLLNELNIDQPAWCHLTSVKDAQAWCGRVGYPCLVRPSYVLSGAAMNVAHSDDDLACFLGKAIQVSPEHPVVLSKFIDDAKEVEVDAVACRGTVKLMAISEHVEQAGVHSGDATLIFPAQDLTHATITAIQRSTMAIAKALRIHGPFNIQFIAKADRVQVIECNLRVSRSFPFVSKTMEVNLVAKATRMWMQDNATDDDKVLWPLDPIGTAKRIGVKVAQFSFHRLSGADILLGVEMQSTGEVACYGQQPEDAYLKALIATGFTMPNVGDSILLSIGSYRYKRAFRDTVRTLQQLGYKLYGTRNTASYYGILEMCMDGDKKGQDTILQWIAKHRFALVINVTERNKMRGFDNVPTNGYRMRRAAIDASVPILTNVRTANLLVRALARYPKLSDIPITADVDCFNKYHTVRIPGLIDMHVHVRDPGETHKETWTTCTQAALAGGITMLCAMPNTKPSLCDKDTYALVDTLAREQAYCDYALFAGASATNATTVATDLGQTCAGLKMYLNQTHGTLTLHDNLTLWSEHIRRWNHPHHPICVHAEGQTLAAILHLASMHKRRIHVCHVSRADEILLIKQAKANGLGVTCEVAPHHLFLNADTTVLPEHLSYVKPMLNRRADQAALWANLDVIDCFATDHAPHTLHDKREHHCPGFPGLETALPLLLTAVHDKRLTLNDIVQRCHTNPKRIFNLPDQPDTYVEVDLGATYTLPDKPQFSKAGWSPFAGMRCTGAVRRVVLRGKTVYVAEQTNRGQVFPPQHVYNVRTMVVVPPPPPPPPALPTTSSSLSIDTATAIRGHVLSAEQWKKDTLRILFQRADTLRTQKHPPLYLKDKRIGLFFYEPSTRTRLSFERAITMLGGVPVHVAAQNSSVKKGETLEDAIQTFIACAQVDAIVLRHPKRGAAARAARVSSVPIINAGDGDGEHPTQTLVDLYTIRDELGTLGGHCVLLVGDLRYGRTVHSLAKALALRTNVRLHYIAPDDSLDMPDDVKAYVQARNLVQRTHITSTWPPDLLAKADIIYMTRLQKERLQKERLPDRIQYDLSLDATALSKVREHARILHPLPRGQELPTEIDTDPRAAYMRQMAHGPYVRAALLSFLL